MTTKGQCYHLPAFEPIRGQNDQKQSIWRQDIQDIHSDSQALLWSRSRLVKASMGQIPVLHAELWKEVLEMRNICGKVGQGRGNLWCSPLDAFLFYRYTSSSLVLFPWVNCMFPQLIIWLQICKVSYAPHGLHQRQHVQRFWTYT